MYKPESSTEGGTLVQLRNLINRRNVGKGKEVKHQVNEVEDFLELVTKCHLVAATMHHFGMKNISDCPSKNGFPCDIEALPCKKCKALFFKQMLTIINNYVVPRKYSNSSSEKNELTQDEVNSNPHLQRILSEHQYCKSQNVCASSGSRHLPSTITNLLPIAHASQKVKSAAPDAVFDYASAMLNDGLLLLEYKDAIREGDGPRILRVWKVLMLYFWYAGHKNYRLEAFHLQSLVNATASPQIAAQLTWGRVMNVRGGHGHNMPLDLEMEHLNCTVKDYVSNLGANVAERTILQCGDSLGGIMSVCEMFDKSNDVTPESVAHTKQSAKEDKKLILKQLVDSSCVFDHVPGRKHKSFPKIHANVASAIDMNSVIGWIKKQKLSLQRNITLARAYGHDL